MRTWLVRLRTLAAAMAAVFMLWAFPKLWGGFAAPQDDSTQQTPPMRIVRVWLCESWTGTGMQWLGKQATAFEKANRGVRVVVRRAQSGDWLAENAVQPDLLLFDAGIVDSPEGMFRPTKAQTDICAPLESAGNWRGISYATPLCYGGYVRLVNEGKPDGFELIMTSEREYSDFAAQKAGSLIATVREARRFTALVDAGKGFPFYAEPYGEWTDRMLLAGAFDGDDARDALADMFVEFLLSDDAQLSLYDYGLLPASARIPAPDETAQPLLFALRSQIISAVNAFDQ